VNAHELTEAMKAAIELEIFTAIREGNATSGAIAVSSVGSAMDFGCGYYLALINLLHVFAKPMCTSVELERMSKEAGFERVVLVSQEIGINRLIITHRLNLQRV
jgi:hypothetical protein